MRELKHDPYNAFFSHCARLGDADIHNITISRGLPVFSSAMRVVRRRDLRTQQSNFSRRQKNALRCAAVDVFKEVGDGVVARVEITAGVPVALWLEEGS